MNSVLKEILLVLVGFVSNLVADAISTAYAPGHITVKNKKIGWVVKGIVWIRDLSQNLFDKLFPLNEKTKEVEGAFFLYRLEQDENQEYRWNYAWINLDMNRTKRVKGEYRRPTKLTSLEGRINGNYVLDRTLVLFVFWQNDALEIDPSEMITIPKFDKESVNVGWAINTELAEMPPLPVVIQNKGLNFPYSLKKEHRVRELLKDFNGVINWDQFKNETE